MEYTNEEIVEMLLKINELKKFLKELEGSFDINE